MSTLPGLPLTAVLSVSELNRSARLLLEQSLPLLWVGGEICDCMRAASGHWYFSLKDRNAQVRCTLFRHKAQYLDWQPKNGMQVEVRALVTLYEARGEFQLNVEAMRQAGAGALFEAFERLKLKLEREGLFAPELKRALPVFPRQIGVVTSPAAAALRDVLTTLKRRMPAVPVVIYPTPVQGRGAAAQIARALGTASARGECDVLILCRGGGSIEDLWEFNEEAVARAIRASRVPVVCGVGHETDFTIADFAADRRAPTPTAAAEFVVPSAAELREKTGVLGARLMRYTQRCLEERMQRLDFLARRLVSPAERLAHEHRHLQHLASRLAGAAHRGTETGQWRLRQLGHRLQAAPLPLARLQARVDGLGQNLERLARDALSQRDDQLGRLATHLQHLNPLAVLQRGYAIAADQDGHIVHSVEQLQPGARLELTFGQGRASAEVLETGEQPPAL